MKRPEWEDWIIIYLGGIAGVGALTDPSWWRWVFFALAIYFFGWGTVRIQKHWGIK